MACIAGMVTPWAAQAYPRHSLSRAALGTSGVPIFLLDAFTEVIVYYAAGAAAHLPFPPPQQVPLRPHFFSCSPLIPPCMPTRAAASKSRVCRHALHATILPSCRGHLLPVNAPCPEGYGLLLEMIEYD